MAKDILINRLDIQLNNDTIDRDFDIIKITCDLRGKQDYGKVINTIYKQVKPLALCHLGKGAYACLLTKGAEHSLDDPHYAIVSIKSADIGKSSNVKLLIGALPCMTTDHQRASEGVGLYYLADVETIRKVEVLRTYEVKIEWEQGKHLVLRIEAATFTPVSYHTNAEGKLYGDCTHLPRIKFDRWTQELTRTRGGEYIKKKHRDRNMSGEMVSLDTKNPAKFWRSKMGILAMFMDDAKRYLSDYLSLEFESLSPEFRIRFKDTDVKATYASINTLLSEKVLNLINLTETDMAPLVAALEKDGLTVTQSNIPHPDALNLAIHHNKDYYQANQQCDPYLQLRAGKKVVIQSAYPETLIKKGKLSQSVYEACKKELFIKWEARSQQLKLIKPQGNWLFVVCDAPKNEVPSYSTLMCSSGKLSFELQNSDCAEQHFLLDLPRTMRHGEHAVIDLGSGDTFLFEDTNYVALPQYKELAEVMHELADGYANGIKRIWIEEFLALLDKGEIDVSNPKLAEQRLSTLLARRPDIETFYKEDIFSDKENKITYKGSLQTFFDWVAAEKGLRLGASLKSQDAGYIEASLGLFYNDEERLYFVGGKDNVKSVPRFCRIRRILTNAESVPPELLKMIVAFHIRHKQATIYPFLFKHLREMSNFDTLGAAETKLELVNG